MTAQRGALAVKAIRVHEYGGPEVMKLEEVPTPRPGADEVLVKVEAAGINPLDTYQRSGVYTSKLYHDDALPIPMGLEGAGVVEAVGPNVSEVKVEDRVAWIPVSGSYATRAVVPLSQLVRLPEGVSFGDGAAAMLQGMTAHYLAHTTYPLKKGDTCLIHAAAGGVGLLLCQMAKQAGARVIGTVSSEKKAKLASEAGADEVIFYTQQDFEAEVKRLTAGKGVQVVYDPVGKDTFEKSLNCLVPRGCLVLFGRASGPVLPYDLQELGPKGSLFVTRPNFVHYILTREEFLQRAEAVLRWIASGQLKVRIDMTFPLAEAVEAHRYFASRQTVGKVLLLP
jgi:NADPH2:quinone reductase